MEKHEWIQKFPAAITVCDADGIILEMNEASAKTFASDGGFALIGKNMFGCHSQATQEKLKKMLANQQENIYTVEKQGQKKLIYQHPWYDQEGKYAGFVEISLPIPWEMPHYQRD